MKRIAMVSIRLDSDRGSQRPKMPPYFQVRDYAQSAGASMRTRECKHMLMSVSSVGSSCLHPRYSQASGFLCFFALPLLKRGSSHPITGLHVEFLSLSTELCKHAGFLLAVLGLMTQTRNHNSEEGCYTQENKMISSFLVCLVELRAVVSLSDRTACCLYNHRKCCLTQGRAIGRARERAKGAGCCLYKHRIYCTT